MSKRILSVGDLVFDLILPVSLPVTVGHDQMITGLRYEPGGAGNFIMAARNLGADVSAAGAVGGDVFGLAMIDMMRDAGVDVAHVDAAPGTTSTLVMVLSDDTRGEQVYVGQYGDGPPVPMSDALHVHINTVDGVYLFGYSFAEARTTAMSHSVLKAAQAAGKQTYFDVGPFLGQVPPGDIQQIVAGVDVLFATADELTFVTDHTEAAAHVDLLALGPSVLVIKRDKDGCTIVTAAGAADYPAYPANVVDTVGAGDCFGAAFVWAHLHGYPLAQCAKIANAMGAAAVQRAGAGRSAPTRAELEAILQQAGEAITLP